MLACRLGDPEVFAGAPAAVERGRSSTAHKQVHGGEPSYYLLIPHERICRDRALAELGYPVRGDPMTLGGLRVELTGQGEDGPSYRVVISDCGSDGATIAVWTSFGQATIAALAPGGTEPLHRLIRVAALPLLPGDHFAGLGSGYTLTIGGWPCTAEFHWQCDAPARWGELQSIKDGILDIARRHVASYAYH